MSLDTIGAKNSLTVFSRNYFSGDVKAIHFNGGVVDLMEFYGQNNKTGNDQVYESPAEWVDAVARGINSLRKGNYVDASYGSSIAISEYLWA